jgi:hypothetical protein
MKNFDQIIADVEACLQESGKLLREYLVDSPGLCGWRQFLNKGASIGTFGTSCGLISYVNIFPDDNVRIERVSKCILDKQKEDGCWDSQTILPDIGLTTATCYNVLALKSAGISSEDPKIQKAAAWLSNLVHPETGGIGNYQGDSSTYFICAALTARALSSIDKHKYQQMILNIVRWLKNNRNADGGFNDRVGTPSTLHHSSEVVIALSNLRDLSHEIGDIMNGANDFITKHWALGQNLYRDVAYVEDKDRRAMLPHTYYTDGLLLQANLTGNEFRVDNQTFLLVDQIIRNQKDGYWEHVSCVGLKPTWSIMECVLGLRKFLSVVTMNKRMIVLENQVQELSGKFQTLESSVSSVSKVQAGITSSFGKIFAIYKWRYLLITLYVGSIYIVLRSILSSTQQLVIDLLGIVFTLIMAVLQYFS